MLRHEKVELTFIDFKSAAVFNIGRTIIGMWRTRTSTLDQKAQVAEMSNDSEERSVLVEDMECFLDVEDTKMSKLYVAELPINVGDWYYNVLCRIY